ncbi:hypothetical protein BH10ACT5_BH10ACT5_05540 [soil metagenome]
MRWGDKARAHQGINCRTNSIYKCVFFRRGQLALYARIFPWRLIRLWLILREPRYEVGVNMFLLVPKDRHVHPLATSGPPNCIDRKADVFHERHHLHPLHLIDVVVVLTQSNDASAGEPNIAV